MENYRIPDDKEKLKKSLDQMGEVVRETERKRRGFPPQKKTGTVVSFKEAVTKKREMTAKERTAFFHNKRFERPEDND